MSTPILTTKLHIPASRSGVIERQRLLDRLNAGLDHKLTLISAPAGSGKTTLVSHWVELTDSPVAWLSLDEGDSDLPRFLTYLAAALQTVNSTVGAEVLSLLESAQSPSAEAVLTLLVNRLSALEQSCVLVLDDFHRTDGQPIDHALTFLLEHQPPRMHVVITTREDPQIPLSRMRARGQLNEIRAADLRFTHAEAAAFLSQMTGLHLPPEAISALEARTEGWIAGLQLAALSMQGRTDTAHFIEAFTGSHRFVLDYLMEEVLERQPEDVRRFLLQTAILERLNASLCDAVTDRAVTGHADSRAMLETLERGNLFVIALDDTRQWYRYHHLFADALKIHLENERPEHIAELHLRASHWYEAHGFLADAIQHALAAQANERTADLLEIVWPEMDQRYQNAVWMRWVKALPEALVSERPLLSLGYAWGLLNNGEVDESASRLGDVERWLNDQNADHTALKARGIDVERLHTLQAAIASARAYGVLTLGDADAALEYIEQALALTSDVHQAGYRQATALRGIAYWVKGDLHTADHLLEEFMVTMMDAGNLDDAVGMPFILWEVRRALGQLRRTLTAAQRSLKVIESVAVPTHMGTGDVYRTLCELYHEWGDFDAAFAHLQTCHTLGDEVALPNLRYRLYITESLLKRSLRDYDGALALLEEAEPLQTRTPVPEVRPIPALKARIWIRQGSLSAADDWAKQHGLTVHGLVVNDDIVNGDITVLREFETITFARLLVARCRYTPSEANFSDAKHLLDRLLHAAENDRRTGSLIEILMLQALLHQAQGDTVAALVPLRRALVLAEPQGYCRLFVDEGEPMAALLNALTAQPEISAYVSRLLASFKDVGHESPASAQPLIEPLSDRELDVLRLLSTELSGPEIADELMVSLNTMRTHTRNIYGKLGVNNRRTAVRRAEELGLV